MPCYSYPTKMLIGSRAASVSSGHAPTVGAGCCTRIACAAINGYAQTPGQMASSRVKPQCQCQLISGAPRTRLLAHCAYQPALKITAGLATKCNAASAESVDGPMLASRRPLLAASLVAVAGSLVPAAGAKTAPKSADSLERVKSTLSDVVAGNTDSVLPNLSSEVVFKFPVAYPGDELGGEYKGRYGVMRYIARQLRTTKDLKVTDLKLQPGDGKDQIIARFRLSGRMAANNSKFSTSVTEVWRLNKDGQVATMTAYYDTTSIAKAAGYKPA